MKVPYPWRRALLLAASPAACAWRTMRGLRELLESRCPHCEAAATSEGACCPVCADREWPTPCLPEPTREWAASVGASYGVAFAFDIARGRAAR
jgi:hypothetical protein